MINDIVTVMWKEWRELLKSQVSSRSGLTGLLIMIALFGIVMPIEWGTMWVESAASLGLWLALPMLLVGMTVAEGFAGTRERHSLQTLLASRLPDRAILLGKIGAVVSFEWVITQLVFIVALLPVNLLHGHGRFMMYRPVVALSGMFLSFLVASLMSNIGVMVSLRAGSVKQVQLKLGISIFIIAYMALMIGRYVLRHVPEQTKDALLQPFLTGEIGMVVLAVSALLLVLIVGSFVGAQIRFQRARLILNE